MPEPGLRTVWPEGDDERDAVVHPRSSSSTLPGSGSLTSTGPAPLGHPVPGRVRGPALGKRAGISLAPVALVLADLLTSGPPADGTVADGPLGAVVPAAAAQGVAAGWGWLPATRAKVSTTTTSATLQIRGSPTSSP